MRKLKLGQESEQEIEEVQVLNLMDDQQLEEAFLYLRHQLQFNQLHPHLQALSRLEWFLTEQMLEALEEESQETLLQ
jgi:hypothetical protein